MDGPGEGEDGGRRSEGKEETEGKEGRTGEQRAKDQSQPASGQGWKGREAGNHLQSAGTTELGGRDATHGRPVGQWGRVANQCWIL